MHIKDIIALAKAGYKASEVKELMALEEKVVENPSSTTPVETELEPDPEPDYKALYEAEKDKVAVMQKTMRTEPSPEPEEEDLTKILAKALDC